MMHQVQSILDTLNSVYMVIGYKVCSATWSIFGWFQISFNALNVMGFMVFSLKWSILARTIVDIISGIECTEHMLYSWINCITVIINRGEVDHHGVLVLQNPPKQKPVVQSYSISLVCDETCCKLMAPSV